MIRSRRRRNIEMPKRDNKRDDKQEHKLDRSASKVEILNAKARKKEAAAKARKWLVILIGIGIAAFYALKGGAGSGLINIIKSKLGM